MILAGGTPNDMGLVRFQPGGAPDETFGPGGKRPSPSRRSPPA